MKFKKMMCSALFLISTTVVAHDLEVCGVSISMKDRRAAVEESIKNRCKLVLHPQEDMTIYIDANQGQGSISYKNGRIKSVSLPSSTFRNSADPVAVIGVLIQALQVASDAAGPPVKISTFVIPASGAKMTVFDVHFKGRRVSVLTKEGGIENGQDVAVTESIVDED